MEGLTRAKWNRAASSYDLMNGCGPERRWAPFKRDLFSAMRGSILFAAVGTGLDIPLFPPGRNIVAIDISHRMIKKARPRALAYRGHLELLEMDVRHLAFPARAFDQVFTSCTFCSVPDPVRGLEEIRRVLKPGGQLQMFEHTGSRYFPFNLILHLMTPLSRRMGPDMNRDTTKNVECAGFQIERVTNLYLDVLKVIVATAPAGPSAPTARTSRAPD